MVLGAAIKIGQVIIKLAKFNRRFTRGGTAIVQRFPPSARPYIRDIIKGANIVSAGGIISDLIQQEWNEFSPPKIKRPPSDKFQKKYQSTSGYNSSRRNGYVSYNKRGRSNACVSKYRSSRRWRYC